MNDGIVSIGAVVRDRFGREGIVCSKEATPSEDWINEQVWFEKTTALGRDVQWWGVMPFGGGYLLCPEPELVWLRPASYEDFRALADTASIHGRERLAKTFPHFVDRLLKERESQH
jgi:hypothetical protein